MNVLIVEDTRDIAENIADYLEPLGYELDFAADGRIGLNLALEHNFDVIVLDIMLPGMDGLSLCRKLREEHGLTTPILMLTARDQIDDKVRGFRAGTDDYLVKPFSMRELEARLIALSRRTNTQVARGVIEIADLNYNPATCEARRGGRLLELNPIQRKLLELLMLNRHRVVTRHELEKEIWGEHPPDRDILRTHIYSLRSIIDKPFPVKLLQTVHGIGYRIHAPESSDGRQA